MNVCIWPKHYPPESFLYTRKAAKEEHHQLYYLLVLFIQVNFRSIYIGDKDVPKLLIVFLVWEVLGTGLFAGTGYIVVVEFVIYVNHILGRCWDDDCLR